MAERLTPEQLIERDRSYVERIISDDNFAYFFLHEKCYNLFRKIQWTIFGNDADYDELINSFYEYLKRPDEDTGEIWHKLKTFDYRTSLFDWIKTVAVRFFYEPCTEILSIPEDVVESGVFEEMISSLKSPEARKYFWYAYLLKYSKADICRRFCIENKQLRLLVRRAETALRKLVKQQYPDYYNRLFHKNAISLVDIDKASHLPSPEDPSRRSLERDVRTIVAEMPNPRYREVIEAIFFKDLNPEEVASLLKIRISNVYNLKSRALEQLRDMVLYSPGELDLLKYINRMEDDRLRLIAYSIFEKKMDYDEIIKQLGTTDAEFKKLKHAAMKDLKLLVFC